MIGNIIKNMRKENNISEEELTKKTGISIEKLKELENNKEQPDFETLEKIANSCDFEIVFINKEENISISKKDSENKNNWKRYYERKNINNFKANKRIKRIN